MKRLLLFSLLLLAKNILWAQQKPYYTQYILNNYILNPALSGIESYIDAKLSYRNQWSGIDGAPVTTYFSIQGPLGSNKDRTTATSFGKSGVNVRGTDLSAEYTTPPKHGGVGLQLINDKTGYINRFSVYASYAYHMPLGPKTAVALGFMGGVTNVSLDRSKITLWDPNDPAIGYNNGELKKLMPEIGAGVWLYGSQYFLGGSVLNIVPGKAKFVKNAKYSNAFAPIFFLTGGYKFYLNDEMSILPSVLLQSVSAQPLETHINAKIQYEDLVWFGGSYRISDQLGGIAAMAGINIGKSINIGYAYDISTSSRLRTYTKNTHEIIIGFLLNNKYGDSCPRNVW